MYVCMSVCNGLTIKAYGFTHSLHTFLAHDAHDAIAMERTQRIRRQRQNKSRDRKRSTAKQKDERQDNRDRRRIAHQHPSGLLCSLTRERDRQRIAWLRFDCTSSFAILSDRTFHMRVRHMMRMRIPSSN